MTPRNETENRDQVSPLATEVSEEWRSHEHVSESVRAQAQKLIDETGSAELAKHVVDEVAAHPADPNQSFAQTFGYQSYEVMAMGSAPVRSSDGKSWYAMLMQGNEWIVWNEDDLPAYRRFQSQDPPQ